VPTERRARFAIGLPGARVAAASAAAAFAAAVVTAAALAATPPGVAAPAPTTPSHVAAPAPTTPPRAPAPAPTTPPRAAAPAPPAPTTTPATDLGVQYVNVAAAAGVTIPNAGGSLEKKTINETVGNGVCIADVDGDGFVDLFIPSGLALPGDTRQPAPKSALYRRKGDLLYEEIGAQAGVALDGYWAQGCVFADYDDDGRADLFVTGFGRYYLFRNLGGLRFEDVTQAAGLAGGRGWSTGAAFGDYDRDGRIDLYVSHYVDYDQNAPPLPKAGSNPNCFFRGFPVMCGPRGLKPQMGRLFHNEGGRFKDVSAVAGMVQSGLFYGLGAAWSDLDNDGDPDLYVATDSTPNLLYRNEGGGRFTEIGTPSGAAFSEEGRSQASMGVAAGDLDHDGLDELFVTNFSHDYDTLYHNEGGLYFSDVSLIAGIGSASTMATLGWGDAFLDVDNDGWRDIFLANGHVYPGIDALNIGTTWKETSQIFRNLGGMRFTEVTAQAGPAFKETHSARGAAVADLDNDGDPDIVVNNMDEPPSLLRNDGGNRRHWIGLRLAGGAKNRGAIGARVTLIAGTVRQVLEVQAGGSHNSGSDPRLLFGLGDAPGPVRAEVRWPSGRKSAFPGLAVDRYHDLAE